MINDEIPLIEETLRNYGESFQEWNIEKLTSAFHPEAMSYWFIPERGGFLKGYCYGWIRMFLRNQKENPGINYITFPEEIDYEGTAAYVRLRFLVDDPQNTRDTTDYLTLVKFRDGWNIVHKSGFTKDVSKEELETTLREKTETKRNDPKEIKEIGEVLKIYAETFHNLDDSKLEKIFHNDMRVNSVDVENNKFRNRFRSLADWKKVIDDHKKMNISFKTEVIKIDQLESSAVAKMRWGAFRDDGTSDTIDYLTLLKIDDNWLIVNKTCYSQFEP
ncbi:MAG: nuclear transport factor 2 family protein [Candidatus Heimdallarchaeaceae archaeon]|jgi:hypothetical protein